MTTLTKIADFNQRLVVPLFEEIRNSSIMARKRRKVSYVEGLAVDDHSANDALQMVHGARRSLTDLATTPAHETQGEWVGHTLIIVEPPEIREAYVHPLAGYFFSSVIFHLPGDERVFVSPWVFYWMRFDNKLHQFAHRYDSAIAEHPIENLTRKPLLQHALDAISFFDMEAFSPKKPW